MNSVNGKKVAFSFSTSPGLTKREYFAGLAMQGWLGRYGADAEHPAIHPRMLEGISKYSYAMADAMIAARKET